MAKVEFAFSDIHELRSGDGTRAALQGHCDSSLYATHPAAKAKWCRQCFIIKLLAPKDNTARELMEDIFR